MTTTMCQSGVALTKAGANVSSAFTSSASADSNWTILINQAESRINALTRYNWTDNYEALNDDVKKIFEDFCSNLAAIHAVLHDMSGFTSRGEAEDILNTLRDQNQNIMSLLIDKKQEDFLKRA